MRTGVIHLQEVQDLMLLILTLTARIVLHTIQCIVVAHHELYLPVSTGNAEVPLCSQGIMLVRLLSLLTHFCSQDQLSCDAQL